MAKTDFTKAESAFQETVNKMQREMLLDIAIKLAGGKVDEKLHERIYLIFGLQLELNRIYRSDKKIYKKLGIKRKELNELLSDPTTITEEQWATLEQLKKEVDKHLKEIILTSDDEIVEQERRKHITKRFNVNEKWLPLT